MNSQYNINSQKKYIKQHLMYIKLRIEKLYESKFIRNKEKFFLIRFALKFVYHIYEIHSYMTHLEIDTKNILS